LNLQNPEPEKKPGNRFFKYLPTFAAFWFFVLSFVAILLYPGGTQIDPNTAGFSWQHNYWCELLNSQAANGQPNPGMPFAAIGMCFLGISMSAFFYSLPVYCPTTKGQQMIVRFCSLIASTFACLLFTGYHHVMLLGFSIFTFLTILTALIILAEARQYPGFSAGITVFIMIQGSNLIYYLNWHKEILPWFQKLTIFLTAFWVVWLSLRLKGPTCRD